MSKQTEALKLALEALEWINRVSAMDYEYQQKARESLNAIYEALADQPAQQQEPVGEAYLCDKCQTPFDGAYYCPECGHNTATKEPVYTSPPAQRKPLTDEEIYDMYNEPRSDAEMLEFARAIEAAHGIKENT